MGRRSLYILGLSILDFLLLLIGSWALLGDGGKGPHLGQMGTGRDSNGLLRLLYRFHR
jgi:hypothetical protein